MADVAIAPDDGVAADEAAYRAVRRRLQWRRRVMPLLGVVGALAVWAGLVYGLEVPPFIAPSPQAVAHTLTLKYDMLIRNLAPTAIEAVAGLLPGQLAAVTLPTAVVPHKKMEEGFLPVVVLVHYIPVLRQATLLGLPFCN